jgi:hypothetical protein
MHGTQGLKRRSTAATDRYAPPCTNRSLMRERHVTLHVISYERVRQKLVFVPLAVYSYGNGKRLARRLVPTVIQFIGHTLLHVHTVAVG